MSQPGPPIEQAPEASAAPGRTAAEIEADLRARLLAPAVSPSVWGWLGPLLVASLAALLRLVNLGRPHEVVFDETYYVKQAYSLLRLGYEGRWAEGANERFVVGDFGGLLTGAEYVVHPPVGKWLIALGIQVLGPESSAGWRLSAAVVGAATVFVLARIARRLFASTLLGCAAGLFLALDGLHLVLSRSGLLDIFLTFFALAAFGAVIRDREVSRARLAKRLAEDAAEATTGATSDTTTLYATTDSWGPRLGLRWWLITAGVLCGLAIGVKWSGAYVLAVLGVLTVAWDLTARRTAGVPLWVGGGLLRDGVPAFLSLVPVAVVTYLATWASWFAHPQAYLRQWAAQNPDLTQAWIPDALESLWEFHRQVWDFHTGLSTPHAYEASAPGWLLQLRPTSFYWNDVADGAACGADRCIQAITALGNPVLWWAGAAALIVVAYAAFGLRDWRAWTILAGYGALWLPWLAYPERTTFTFYAVALAPFVALSLTYGVAILLGWNPRAGDGASLGAGTVLARVYWARPGPWIAVAIMVLAVAAAVFFWPVWTAEIISYDEWSMRLRSRALYGYGPPSWV